MIIALGHEAGTGKDTFVMFAIDYLRQKYKQLDIQREGFADRLYDLCYSLYSWAGFKSRHYYIANPKAKEEILPAVGKTPRQLLIGIAEKVREFDPCAWLKPVLMNKPAHLKWITDLRTPEEVKQAKETGIYLLKIDRPDAPRIECNVSAMLRGWNGWDEIIINDGNLEVWRNKAIEFCERKIVPHLRNALLVRKE